MPGRRSLMSVSRVLESVNDAMNKTRERAGEKKDDLTRRLGEMGIEVPLLDVEIQFIGASNLPKMDVVGLADPYFVAKVDDQISFVSNVIKNNLAPIWNETWRLKNVPATATLTVSVMDKDEGSTTDDFIGKFSCSLSLSGAQEREIEGPVLALRKARGTFWLKIQSKKSTMRHKQEFQYLFDGPIRFTRHFSPTVGLFTSSAMAATHPGAHAPGGSEVARRDALLYSTWKFHLEAVRLFFRDVHQPWNDKYPAAQKIFGSGPGSLAVRGGIQAGHRMLYARLAGNGVGVIDNRREDGTQEPVSLRDVLNAGAAAINAASSSSTSEGRRSGSQDGHSPATLPPTVAVPSGVVPGELRIKPAVYTYIISSADDTWRFSETGAAFFVDFASKHALHSNCAQHVRYSGEFHPRPVGGWANFNDSIADDEVEWELVVDNNSGTYAPDKMVLPTVKECLEFNFGCGRAPGNRNARGERGFSVVVYDREDERLVESREACRAYAVTVRGVNKDDLEPHVGEGEVTLNDTASPKGQERFNLPDGFGMQGALGPSVPSTFPPPPGPPPPITQAERERWEMPVPMIPSYPPALPTRP